MDGNENYPPGSPFGDPLISPDTIAAYNSQPELPISHRKAEIRRRDINLERELFLAASRYSDSPSRTQMDGLIKKSAFYEGALHIYELFKLQNEAEILQKILELDSSSDDADGEDQQPSSEQHVDQ